MINYVKHLWHVAFVDPHASQGSQSAFVAAMGLVGLSDIPKEWLIAAVLAMFGWISFFVKRDYQRINAVLERIEKEQGLQRESLAAMKSDFVTHREMGDSVGRVHEKVNRNAERIAAHEVHTGFFRLAQPQSSPPPAAEPDPSSTQDKSTPPA